MAGTTLPSAIAAPFAQTLTSIALTLKKSTLVTLKTLSCGGSVPGIARQLQEIAWGKMGQVVTSCGSGVKGYSNGPSFSASFASLAGK